MGERSQVRKRGGVVLTFYRKKCIINIRIALFALSEKPMKLILIVHNVRSAHNVGVLFRTADGAGVEKIILTGYTQEPPKKDALYHTPAEKAFLKTSLGAKVAWEKKKTLSAALRELKKEGYEIVGLEQHGSSVLYHDYVPKEKVGLIVGNEVRGIASALLKYCDAILEIPMYGHKDSHNVSVAAGIALYQITSAGKSRERKKEKGRKKS